MKEWQKNVMVLFITLGILFIILEITLAATGLAELHRDSTYRMRHETLHHSFIPGARGEFTTSEWDTDYVINSLGYRDEELSPSLPEDTTVILMLGDSYTEGYGVQAEESFSSRLEKKFNEDNVEVEVINTGVGSYSPILELLVLRDITNYIQPDVIIVNYDWSDAQDDYRYDAVSIKENGTVVAVPPPPLAQRSFVGTIRNILSRTSHTYQFIATRLAFTTSVVEPGDIDNDRLIFTRDGLTRAEREDIFSHSEPYLLAIQEEAEKLNATLIIHTYPYAHQVSTTAWQGRSTFFFEEELYTVEPFDIMNDFGEENNITVISSLDAFAKHNDPASLYFVYDGHFNAAGHDVVAQNLHKELEPFIS